MLLSRLTRLHKHLHYHTVYYRLVPIILFFLCKKKLFVNWTVFPRFVSCPATPLAPCYARRRTAEPRGRLLAVLPPPCCASAARCRCVKQDPRGLLSNSSVCRGRRGCRKTRLSKSWHRTDPGQEFSARMRKETDNGKGGRRGWGRAARPAVSGAAQSF